MIHLKHLGRKIASWPRRLQAPFLAGVFYLFCAVLATWPVVLNLKTHVLGDPSTDPDQIGSMWMHWFVFKRGFGVFFDAVTDLLKYPFEENPFYRYFNFLDGYFSIPFQYWFGWPGYYSIFTIVLLALAGLAAFFLLRRLAGNDWVAWAGGAIFAFNPYVYQSVKHGQLFLLLSMVALPLYALALYRVLDDDGIIYPFLAGGALALVFLSYWYYGPVALLITLLFVIHMSLLAHHPRADGCFILRLVITALVFALVIMPFLIPFLSTQGREATAISGMRLQPYPDWLRIKEGILLDPRVQTLLRDGCSLEFPFVYGADPTPGATRDTSRNLPVVAVVLALVLGLGMVGAGQGRDAGFWLVSSLILYLLCLGTYLKLGGQLVLLHDPVGQGERALALPMFYAYQYLPLLSRFLWPSRFIIPLLLTLVAVLACGLGWVAKSRRFHPALVVISLLLLLVLTGRELYAKGQYPLAAMPVKIPSFYQQLAGIDKAYIIEVPIGASQCARLYQIVHGQKTSGGEVGTGGFTRIREYQRFLRENTFLRFLRALQDDPKVVARAENALNDQDWQTLIDMGFAYVVVHRKAYYEIQPRAVEVLNASAVNTLTRLLGRPVYADDQITVFSLVPGG